MNNKRYFKKDTEKMFIKSIKKLQYKKEINKINDSEYIKKRLFIFDYLRKNYKISCQKASKVAFTYYKSIQI